MNFETLLKQIVKEAVVEALSEVEPKNWTTNDIHEEPHNEAPSVEPEEEVTVEEPETEDVDLGSMKLKELREYAEELGLNSKGKRAEVEERIREFLENEGSENEEVEEPEVEEESEEPEIEEDEDSEEAEDDEVEDETYAKVMQYVNEASDDELRETLEELGLSSKGKREALVEKIYQAVKDGLFEFEEEDEEPSEEPDEEVEETEEVEVEDTEDDSEEDDSEDLGMTEARLKSIEAMEIQVQEEFEEGKITRKEMVAYLKQVGIAVTKKVEDEAVVEMYTEKLALLIDDEGEFHDEGGDPYNINEVPYCCGAPLEEIEGGYRCNVCGTEYEAE